MKVLCKAVRIQMIIKSQNVSFMLQVCYQILKHPQKYPKKQDAKTKLSSWAPSCFRAMRLSRVRGRRRRSRGSRSLNFYFPKISTLNFTMVYGRYSLRRGTPNNLFLMDRVISNHLQYLKRRWHSPYILVYFRTLYYIS